MKRLGPILVSILLACAASVAIAQSTLFPRWKGTLVGIADYTGAQFSSANPLPVAITSKSGTFTIAGCTVGTSVNQCLASGLAINHVQIQNASTSTSIACTWAGGNPVLNGSGSFQLTPGGSGNWGPTTAGVPSGSLNCIASAASTPLYVEYN